MSQQIENSASEFKAKPSNLQEEGINGNNFESSDKKPFSKMQGSATDLKGFENADWELALKRRDKAGNQFYKGKEIQCGVDLTHFKMYGPGIYLFFNFLKNLSILFLILSIFSLCPIIYNTMVGNSLQHYPSGLNKYISQTTIANINSTQEEATTAKLINVVVDLLISLSVIVFYYVWLKDSSNLSEEVRKEVYLRSYNALELVEFSKEANEENVKKFMQQFGSVEEVSAVNNYDDTIYLSKKIYQLEFEKKKLKMDKPTGMEEKIQQIDVEIDQLFKELVLIEDDHKEENIKFYVTFSNMIEKRAALAQLNKHEKGFCNCCSDETPKEMLLCNDNVKVVPCHTEPGEIIWQNQHVTWKSRWARLLCQYFFILVLLVIAFAIICFVNVLAPATATEVVDTTSYTQTTIKAESNSTIVQAWCLSNQQAALTTSDSDLSSLCNDFIKDYYFKVGITFAISLVAVMMKFLMSKVVIWFAKFQRYKNHSQQSQSITFNLFVTETCITVLIIFLMQIQIDGMSLKNLISFISDDYINGNISRLKTYNDFSTNWYVDIGSQIFITWIIVAVHPGLTMPIVHYVKEKIKMCLAKGQKIQKQMDKKVEKESFEIEEHSANILMIVFVTLAFCGGMPIMMIGGFLALAFRYLYLKLIFVRFCKIPKTFDEELNNKIAGIIPYALFIHFGFSIWMFGRSDILPSDSSVISTYIKDLENIAVLNEVYFLLERVFATWYYSLVFLLFLIFSLLKLVIYNCIAKCFMKQQKEVEMSVRQINVGSKFAVQSSKEICSSYKIENNPDYQEILAIMSRKKKYFVKVKEDAVKQIYD